MLHPTEPPRKSYLETVLEGEKGVFVAVSDNMKLVPDQIAPWIPGGLSTLGTDGFGRSDTRENLRRFFEVDAESTVIGTLYALARKGEIEMKTVAQAIKDLKVDPEKLQFLTFLVLNIKKSGKDRKSNRPTGSAQYYRSPLLTTLEF